MTRLYVMVNRMGREQGIEIEHLTPKEREQFLAKWDLLTANQIALRWANALSDALATLERERGRPRKARK